MMRSGPCAASIQQLQPDIPCARKTSWRSSEPSYRIPAVLSPKQNCVQAWPTSLPVTNVMMNEKVTTDDPTVQHQQTCAAPVLFFIFATAAATFLPNLDKHSTLMDHMGPWLSAGIISQASLQHWRPWTQSWRSLWTARMVKYMFTISVQSASDMVSPDVPCEVALMNSCIILVAGPKFFSRVAAECKKGPDTSRKYPMQLTSKAASPAKFDHRAARTR